jgi:polyhydroxyalkanoate synthesis regulator phasin
VQPVVAAVELLSRVVDEFDASALDRDALLSVAEAFGRAGKLAAAGMLLVAPALENTGAFRRDGHRNAEDLLAKLTGTSTGTAARTARTAKKLADRPEAADAVRKGELSADQANTIADADPQDQTELLDVAKRRGLKGLRDAAERLAAARRSEEDAMDRYRRVHRDRHLRTWMRDGAFCFAGSTTPDEGARLLAGIEAERERLFKQAHLERRHESNDAYAMDALTNVVAGTAVQPKRAKAALTLRADAAAIERGHLERGERCEIEGVGPIPVTVARTILAEAQIHGVVFNGTDVHDVSTVTRVIPASVRRALEARDPCCVVPTCDQTKGLEIDHIYGYAITRHPPLDELDRKCRTHHRLKTLFGWRLTGPPGNRQWLPPIEGSERE